jgi:amino acid transporter
VKLPAALTVTALLLVANLRGVRESILVLAPIFAVFVLSHVILIASAIGLHLPELGATAGQLTDGLRHDLGPSGIGLIALAALFLNAYALGGGTYTGIEAVSNALPLMREPRIRTARRTMALLAWSLALCAGGLIVGYLLWHITPQPGKTMNAVLVEAVAAHLPGGGIFTTVTLVSAGALLVVAAQAGFIGGPRVMANLAADAWLPRRFTRLSDRLVTEQGVVTIGAAALIALLFTHGAVEVLVVMYSINVFLTFTLTMAGMLVHWWRRQDAPARERWTRLALFGINGTLCAGILLVTVVAKFGAGGWVTVVATGLVVALCLLVRDHYRRINARLITAFQPLLPAQAQPKVHLPPQTGPHSPPTLVVLAGSWNGTGWHTLLNALRTFPDHYQQVIIAGVVEVDAVGETDPVIAEAALRERLAPWIPHVQALGLPVALRTTAGTEADAAVENLCRRIRQDHPRLLVVAGKVLVPHEGFLHRLLHNDTALAVQRRLQWAGIPVHIVAARLDQT